MFSGNAISCDCQLRPVRRWALSLSYIDPAWSQYHCEDPEEVDTMPLLQVPEKLMICNTSETTELLDKDEYQLTPDVNLDNFPSESIICFLPKAPSFLLIALSHFMLDKGLC